MDVTYPIVRQGRLNSRIVTIISSPETSSFPPQLEENFTSRNPEQCSFNVMREFQEHVQATNTFDPNETSPTTFFSPHVEFVGSEIEANSSNNSVILNLDNVNDIPEAPAEPGFQVAHNEAGGHSASNTVAVREMIEAQQYLQFLLNYLPFTLILLAKALYDNCESIFNLMILYVTFVYANSVVKQEATIKASRSFCKLFMALLCIFACFAFIAYVFEDEKLYLNVVFIPAHKKPSTEWNLLWATGLTDFILKLITVVFKILLIMLPGWIVPFSKRGKLYLFIEATSQLYRSLATIQPWLFYLLESYQGAEKIVGVFLAAAYMVTKATDLMIRLKLFKTSIITLIQNVAFGTVPSKEQMESAGNTCSICHDMFDPPVQLQCMHVFCEGCIGTWFDRERTCPLCRTAIVDNPAWRDGSTTFFVQLF